jgi:hypothetical protein
MSSSSDDGYSDGEKQFISLNKFKNYSDDERSCSDEQFLSMNKFKTDNGATSYSIGSHDPRVVLFTKSIRGMELRNPSNPDDTEKFLEFLLEKCWKESPLDTLKLIFHIRDCRQGKGEKLIFRASCRWLLEYHSSELKSNLKHIPFYGTWKDPLQIFGGTVFEKKVIKIHTTQLKTDLEKLELRGDGGLNCVLDLGAAKFAPSEGCEFDKRWRLTTKFASALNVNKAIYRKKYLRPLRSAGVKIVEEQMCEKDWENINFSTVPSIAGKKYKDAFKKHCPEKYESFIENVIKGEVKMNVSVLTPVDILKDYISGCYGFSNSIKRNPVIEAQWYQMISDQRKRRNILSLESGLPIANALCVVDVSGSMFSGMGNGFTPIQVSLGLGLTISLLNDEKSPFFRKWITFSGNPKMETLKGNELHEMINNMDQKNWSQNTNFESVFDLILETATAFSVPQANMPSMLIVISDMQFDEVESGKTNWDTIETKYEKNGYIRPTLVFWNANSKTMDMPVPHSDVPNCALISGFSANLLDPLIDGVVPSPFFLMRKVIDSDRYERISYSHS